VIDIIKENFKAHNFSFFGMFKDEQMKLADQYLEQSAELAYDSYRKIYDRNYNILNVMKNAKLQIPVVLKQNIEMVINIELNEVLSNSPFNLEKFEDLVEEVEKWDVRINTSPLNNHLNIGLERLFTAYLQDVSNTHLLEKTLQVIQLSKRINLEPDMVSLQNLVFLFSKDLIQGKNTPFDGQQAVLTLLEQLASEINIDLTGLKKESLLV
jgi:hypothetical protein